VTRHNYIVLYLEMIDDFLKSGKGRGMGAARGGDWGPGREETFDLMLGNLTPLLVEEMEVGGASDALILKTSNEERYFSFLENKH